MNVAWGFFRGPTAATLALLVCGVLVRAADDVVREDEPTPPAPANGGFGGQLPGGRVIIMPGLRLQVGGQGQLQVQGNVRVPAGGATEAAGVEGRREPYLGVVAEPVGPAVRAQLDLPEGVGLSIDSVEDGSPAAQAGVRQFDVLRTFNDQIVCSPEQLQTLVKVVGATTRVPLTIIRGGRERVVEVVIGEHAVADNALADAGVRPLQQLPNVEGLLRPGLEAGGLGPQIQADIERKLAEALAGAGAGGVVPPGLLPGVMPGVAGNLRAQVLTIGPDAQSATVVSDARGTVEIRAQNGKKKVTVKDAAGAEVHAGPLDTAEDLARVPEDYRDWVREVDGGQPAVQEIEPEDEAADGPDNPSLEPAAKGPTI